MQAIERIDAIVNHERDVLKQGIGWSAIDAEFLCRSDFTVHADHGPWDEDS